MLQIVHIPNIQYAGETPEQAAERDRKTEEYNRKVIAEWRENERQRRLPMRSMRAWAYNHGLIQ